MKLLILILLAGICHAAPVTLEWDAVPYALAYELRYGTDPDKLQPVKVDGLEHTLDLPPGDYHFEVVATAGSIRSEPSDRITHTVELGKPTRFRVRIDATVTITPEP